MTKLELEPIQWRLYICKAKSRKPFPTLLDQTIYPTEYM